MPYYRKKPVVIEAMRFTDEDKDRVFNFVTCNKSARHDAESGDPILDIQTLEGVMSARLGDWVIKGVEGEFYPCAHSVFEKLHEMPELNEQELPHGEPARGTTGQE